MLTKFDFEPNSPLSSDNEEDHKGGLTKAMFTLCLQNKEPLDLMKQIYNM